MKKIHRSTAVLISLMILFTIYGLDAPDASAVTVARIYIDTASCQVRDITRARISGLVKPGAGQTIVLASPDKKKILGSVKVARTGKNGASFSIKVPESALKGLSSTTLYIRSGSAKGVASSGYVPVRLEIGFKAETATKAKAATKAKTTTKAKTATRAKAKAAGKNNKKVKKNNKRPTTAAEGRKAAVAWARMIAKDNSFSYGATPYSRHNGCYFCKTNGGKKRRAKGTKWAKGYKGKKWGKTYCCNPFVHACYAHGAQHPKMLKYCRSMQAIDMGKRSYRKMGCFKCLGKPKFSKLIAGDIFVGSSHVWLYCGNNELAEATSLGGRKRSWSSDSIRVCKGAKKRYRQCRFVMRFTGY